MAGICIENKWLGEAQTGASVSVLFKLSKAAWASSDQLKGKELRRLSFGMPNKSEYSGCAT